MKKVSFFAVLLVILLAIVISTALADGTETLGAPSISIAEGTGIAVGGVGLCDQCTPAGSNPGDITVNVPAGATVNQVLLYWHGAMVGNPAAHPDMVDVDGTSVTGTLIGGPTNFFLDAWDSTLRADITALGLVGPGTSTFSVGPLGYDQANLGAGVLVIYDDGSDLAFIDLRDGQDLAYLDFSGLLQVTVPQTFGFAAEPSDRTADLGILAGSAQPGTSNTIRVTTGGVTIDFSNLLLDADGPQFDALTVSVNIPAGADSLTVELISGPGADAEPSSLGWLVGALSVPVTPPGGEGCTPGFWQGGNGKKLWNAANDPHWVAAGGQGTNPFVHTTLFNDFFTPYENLDGFTMYQLVKTGGGADDWQKAARDVVAAYLNSSFGLNYPYSPAEIAALWTAAVASGDFAGLHGQLAPLNELGCRL